MRFVNGLNEIPQWAFLSVPVCALEWGCALKYPAKRFELHFRVRRPKWCQNCRGCVLNIYLRF